MLVFSRVLIYILTVSIPHRVEQNTQGTQPDSPPSDEGRLPAREGEQTGKLWQPTSKSSTYDDG